MSRRSLPRRLGGLAWDLAWAVGCGVVIGAVTFVGVAEDAFRTFRGDYDLPTDRRTP